MFKSFLPKFALAAFVLFHSSLAAWATAYTLDTTVAGESVSIEGALFNQSQYPSGSGGYTSLFRVHASGTESGYNYAGTPKPFDQVNGVGIYHINLQDLPYVTIGGINYIQIHFDANNAAGLTFTDFRVYQHSDPMNLDPQILVTSEANLGNLGTLAYSMLGTNAGGSNTLALTAFPSGSGTDNMTINIPLANFLTSGWSATDDIYIFAKMTNAEGGFEEFAFLQGGQTVTSLIPEAHTVWGGGAMVAGLLIGCAVQRRRKRAAAAMA